MDAERTRRRKAKRSRNYATQLGARRGLIVASEGDTVTSELHNRVASPAPLRGLSMAGQAGKEAETPHATTPHPKQQRNFPTCPLLSFKEGEAGHRYATTLSWAVELGGVRPSPSYLRALNGDVLLRRRCRAGVAPCRREQLFDSIKPPSSSLPAAALAASQELSRGPTVFWRHLVHVERSMLAVVNIRPSGIRALRRQRSIFLISRTIDMQTRIVFFCTIVKH